MELRVIEKTIDKMKKYLLQVDRNPFLPERVKNQKLKEINNWILDVEKMRDKHKQELLKNGS